MKTYALAVLLAFISSNAMSEWSVTGKNDVITQYADLTTLQKAGNRAKMWGLADFNQAQIVKEATEDEFLSAKSQQDYDCARKQTRLISYAWFSEHMGQEKVVFSYSAKLFYKIAKQHWNGRAPSQVGPRAPDGSPEILWKLSAPFRWRPVAPGSADEILWKIACN
jgi:peptidyl-tRNA hydrolase